ncbi:hypothetical protein C8Q79DRAFT_689857 [Trametes meyenii]|nr:hypothetical protein C8Q79DRAFT_689857 [Trametes meyenii]
MFISSTLAIDTKHVESRRRDLALLLCVSIVLSSCAHNITPNTTFRSSKNPDHCGSNTPTSLQRRTRPSHAFKDELRFQHRPSATSNKHEIWWMSNEWSRTIRQSVAHNGFISSPILRSRDVNNLPILTTYSTETPSGS